MWSFVLYCCCVTFVHVKKINKKNDQSSTICNICDGEIHTRVWGWVDSLLPDCGSLTMEQKNNSWIKPNWWMAFPGKRGTKIMLHDTNTVTTFPGLEDGFEMLQIVYHVDAQWLTDISWNSCYLLYAFLLLSMNAPFQQTPCLKLTQSQTVMFWICPGSIWLLCAESTESEGTIKEATHEHLRCFWVTIWSFKLSMRLLGPTGTPLETALRRFGTAIANCWCGTKHMLGPSKKM